MDDELKSLREETTPDLRTCFTSEQWDELLDAALREAYQLGEASKESEYASLQARCNEMLHTISEMRGEWVDRVQGWIVELRKRADRYCDPRAFGRLAFMESADYLEVELAKQKAAATQG